MSDPVTTLKQMVASIKKDAKAHTKPELLTAAEEVFGSLDERVRNVNKQSFVAWLIHEVDTLDVVEVDGSKPAEPALAPFPTASKSAPKKEAQPKRASNALVVVTGLVDTNAVHGKNYKIRKGQQIEMTSAAAEFFRGHKFVE